MLQDKAGGVRDPGNAGRAILQILNEQLRGICRLNGNDGAPESADEGVAASAHGAGIRLANSAAHGINAAGAGAAAAIDREPVDAVALRQSLGRKEDCECDGSEKCFHIGSRLVRRTKHDLLLIFNSFFGPFTPDQVLSVGQTEPGRPCLETAIGRPEAVGQGAAVHYLPSMKAAPETIQKNVVAGRRNRYVGEVIYMFAFDVAYEMTRHPVRELLGQSVAE